MLLKVFFGFCFQVVIEGLVSVFFGLLKDSLRLFKGLFGFFSLRRRSAAVSGARLRTPEYT